MRSNVQYLGGTCPYQWFRYALLVRTVARVHFLNLKALVCILISMGSTWDIGTKYRYVIPQGFGSQMCTLTIPTICTIDTVMKVVRRIKQWCDCRANNGPILKISDTNLPLKKSADEDKEIRHHQPSSPAAASSCQVTQTSPLTFVAVAVALVWRWSWRWHWRWRWRWRWHC